jgi:hypothetical protein
MPQGGGGGGYPPGATLYDEFSGTNGSSLSGRTPLVGDVWSASQLAFGNGEVADGYALKNHSLGLEINEVASHASELTNSWTTSATMKVVVQLVVKIENLINDAFGSTKLSLGISNDGSDADPPIGGFYVYISNTSSNTQVIAGWEVTDAVGIGLDSGATALTPTVGDTIDIKLVYDSGTVTFYVDDVSKDTATVAYGDLSATVSHGILRVASVFRSGDWVEQKRLAKVDTALIAFES